jgi:hypothetical protein
LPFEPRSGCEIWVALPKNQLDSVVRAARCWFKVVRTVPTPLAAANNNVPRASAGCQYRNSAAPAPSNCVARPPLENQRPDSLKSILQERCPLDLKKMGQLAYCARRHRDFFCNHGIKHRLRCILTPPACALSVWFAHPEGTRELDPHLRRR